MWQVTECSMRVLLQWDTKETKVFRKANFLTSSKLNHKISFQYLKLRHETELGYITQYVYTSVCNRPNTFPYSKKRLDKKNIIILYSLTLLNKSMVMMEIDFFPGYTNHSKYAVDHKVLQVSHPIQAFLELLQTHNT